MPFAGHEERCEEQGNCARPDIRRRLPAVASQHRQLGGRSKSVRVDVADEAVRPAIAPGPAEAVVEHLERVARCKLRDRGGILAGLRSKHCCSRNDLRERLGVMRGNYPTRQRDVGQVLAIGMGRRVRMLRRAAKRELSGGRKPPAR